MSTGSKLQAHGDDPHTDEQLHGGVVAAGRFAVDVQIGATSFALQVDTGSAVTAVPAARCVDCGGGGGGGAGYPVPR